MSVDLGRLLRPRSIAVVGASVNESRLPGRPIPILRRHGFEGAIFPVNPRYEQVGGLRCYGDVTQIPDPVDVALVVVPAAHVAEVLRQCGEAGIGNAIIISSGFEESADGVALSHEVRRLAHEHHLNVIGPNSEGVWSVPGKALMTFGSAALRDDVDLGPVSVVSQSGSIGGATVANLQRRGIGARYFVSVGNETTLGTMDVLDYLVDEGESRVITVYVEGLTGGERLRSIGIRAARQGCSLVLLRGGRSDAGRVVSASHTGKVATASSIYAAVLRQCGVVEVSSVSELVEAADVLVTGRLGRDPGRSPSAGVSAIAPGGSRVLIADAAAQRGLALASFAEETEQALGEVVPAFGSTANPVDVTGQVVNDRAAFERVVEVVGQDPATDALLVQYSNRGLQRLEEIREMLARPELLPAGVPAVIGFLADVDALGVEERRRFRELGAVTATGPETAMKYLDWMYRARSAADAAAGRVELDAPTVSAGDTQPRTWAAQEELLASCGIPTPASVVVSADDWAEQTATLALPVVVKALPEDVEHKTELGLVHLGITDMAGVATAVADVVGRPGLRRALVQETVSPGIEALVSVRRDPDFGPVLSFGLGGTLVELLDDVTHCAIPCSRPEIASALAETRLGRLLASGLRGRKPADAEALLDVLEGLARHYLDLGLTCELELNPVVVHESGDGVTALDVLVVDGPATEGAAAAPVP